MIKEFGEMTGFPPEASDYLEECLKEASVKSAAFENYLKAMDEMFCREDKKYLETLDIAAKECGLDRRTSDMIFLIMSSIPLKYIYKSRNLPYELYVDTITDLRYKLMECKKVYGVWGTFVTEWFQGFYSCSRYKLGRLQYEISEFPYENYKNILKKGDEEYFCHIPSCGPLNEKDVIDSLKSAYAFYSDRLSGGILPVVCSSWLLYPPHYEVFPEGSNLRKFYNLFDIIDSTEDPKNGDFWRIFDREYDGKTENMEEKTSLQRRFKRFFAAGNNMGSGYGVILFDGKNIVNSEKN
jgi:hypothetical protein